MIVIVIKKFNIINSFLLQDTEDLEKDTREELPVNTSKARPKQEKACSLKTMSTSDPAEVLIKNSQVTFKE
jgi:hypothetical protein